MRNIKLTNAIENLILLRILIIRFSSFENQINEMGYFPGDGRGLRYIMAAGNVIHNFR